MGAHWATREEGKEQRGEVRRAESVWETSGRVGESVEFVPVLGFLTNKPQELRDNPEGPSRGNTFFYDHDHIMFICSCS